MLNSQFDDLCRSDCSPLSLVRKLLLFTAEAKSVLSGYGSNVTLPIAIANVDALSPLCICSLHLGLVLATKSVSSTWERRDRHPEYPSWLHPG